MIEPGTEYTHGWHIDCLAAHLEAVSRGEILRLLLNVPPGTMKSLLVSVLWPAWEWGPFGRPDMRYVTASYDQKLTTRDNRRMRVLVESDWYQERWPVKMAGDQNEKLRFENESTGFRVAKSIKSLTGERGHRLIIDDPHSTEMAESEAERETSLRIFRESAPSRLVEPKTSVIIVVMQRLHEADISGWIIENAPEYHHVMLPMRFEKDRACTSPFYPDPRTEEGELLFPDRFPLEVVERDERIMGEYATACQFAQRPAPREGGLFKADRIAVVDELPEHPITWVRAWDLAGTEGAGAFTAGVLIGRYYTGERLPATKQPVASYIIGHVARAQKSPHAVQVMVKDTALTDGKKVRIRIPQDPGQSGKGQVLDYAALLNGYPLKWAPVTGDKEMRALPFATQVEAGRVSMLKGEWNDAFIAELRMFPSGKYKDQVDAASDAYAELLTLGDNATLHAASVPLAAPYMGGA